MQVHGHRGCRGLLPENTLVAFQKALDLRVDTLEMDVCISKDLQVVVSHEPWFNHEISTQPDGKEITAENEHAFKLFHMPYADIKTFDCGLKLHPRFPLQQKIAAYKPLLSGVIAYAEAFSNQTIHYNIEIKYTEEGLNTYHPDVAVFSTLVLDVLKQYNITQRTMVQCFDACVLNHIHATNPTQMLSFLVEEQGSVVDHLKKLNFIPQVYSPDYALVTKDEVEFCHQKNMFVIPWTINDEATMNDMIKLGVDGMISDFPDRLLNVLR